MEFKEYGNTYTLKQYIARALDGSDYERGALEAVQAGNDKVQEAFANLIEVLVEKGALNKNDIKRIV